MKSILSAFIFFFFSFQLGFGQETNWNGWPNIRNISPEEYNGHVQNWGITQDSNQVIYVANNQAILRYAGASWSIIELPKPSASSIASSKEGKVFVGSMDEFGYISNDSNLGHYQSLIPLIINEDIDELGDFIDIISVKGATAFLTSGLLAYYDGANITLHRPEGNFYTLFERKGAIHVWDTKVGLLEVKTDELTLIEGGSFFSDKNFMSYLKAGDHELFCSYQKCYSYDGNTFTPFEMEVDDYLASNYMDESLVLLDSTILIGTRRGGIVQIDKRGNVLLKVDEEHGLINNVVLGIYEDSQGSIWAATNNGISKIDLSLPIRYFDERSSINEPIYDIIEFNGRMFFASDTGIYMLNEAQTQVKKFGIGSYCNGLYTFQTSLLAKCGGQLFVYSENQFKPVELELSARYLAIYDETHIVYGDGGLFRIITLNSEFKETPVYEFSETFSGVNSVLVDDKGILWMGSSSKGLKKIEFTVEGDTIVGNSAKEFLTDLKNSENLKRVYVTEINDEPAFLTWGKGIQRYDYENDTFYLEQDFGKAFADTSKQYFLAEEDQNGNIWFRAGGEFQAAILKEDSSFITYEGALKMIDHRQSNVIYPDQKGFIWFGTDKGLVRFNSNHNFDHSQQFHTQINEVLVRNDSLINGGSPDQTPVLDYKDNELRFTYAGASYFNAEETEYRVQLEGFDENWGLWTSETQKDYTNIPEGAYSFKVQARNVFGVVSESKSFSFSVLPPWYRTWWAYLLYAISIGGLLYVAYKIRINQLLRVQRIRNNIASDLHDEVSATLSSISYFAQAIKSDRVTGDKNRFVDLIANSAGDAKEKITDIVWAINPEHDDWQNFLAKCRRFASDLLESKDMNYSLKIDEYIPGKLDMQLRQHLWLIYKEMVTNAVRHSDAKNLDVILKYQDGKLRLVVQDDGKGMDVDGVKKGNGLVNIHKRADLINADISLKTSKGFGTRWVLKVPL